MKINVRPAVEADKLQAIYVEGQATPNLRYLERMWYDFTSKPHEPLYVAELNDKLVGIGKFTVLPDNSAWLETLRVDKEYQGMGVGKAIYMAYLSQAEKLNINTIRMYTGVKNAASAGLARLNGFELAGQYSGADYIITHKDKACEKTDFKTVSATRAIDLLEPLADKWNGFTIMNRTFYKMNKSLYKYLANSGFVYYNEATGDLVVLGSRFMPERGLQLGLYEGKAKSCFDFAISKAIETGINKLSIMLPPELGNEKSELVDYGFTLQSSDCIVMESVK